AVEVEQAAEVIIRPCGKVCSFGGILFNRSGDRLSERLKIALYFRMLSLNRPTSFLLKIQAADIQIASRVVHEKYPLIFTVDKGIIGTVSHAGELTNFSAFRVEDIEVIDSGKMGFEQDFCADKLGRFELLLKRTQNLPAGFFFEIELDNSGAL